MTKRRQIPDGAGDAVDKYREFHRLDPKQIGAFSAAFAIPQVMYRAGRARWVTYRSNKVDPETLRRPRQPVNYIHEHDAGVVTYLPKPRAHDARVDVPARYRDVPAMVRLGYCLGFSFDDHQGEQCEAQGTHPLPDLYTTPDGTCLIVIQDRRHVLAMMWGGALGVYARGIDG